MNVLQAVRKAPVLPGLDVERIRADFPILKILKINLEPGYEYSMRIIV